MRFVLHQAGLPLPDYLDVENNRRPIRHANEFWEHYGVPVHAPCRQPGDLVLFPREQWHPRYNGGQPTHIGIVIDHERYIHSPGQPDLWVEVQPLVEKPIVPAPGQKSQYTTDPIGYKAPIYRGPRATYRFPMRVVADY